MLPKVYKAEHEILREIREFQRSRISDAFAWMPQLLWELWMLKSLRSSKKKKEHWRRKREIILFKVVKICYIQLLYIVALVCVVVVTRRYDTWTFQSFNNVYEYTYILTFSNACSCSWILFSLTTFISSITPFSQISTVIHWEFEDTTCLKHNYFSPHTVKMTVVFRNTCVFHIQLSHQENCIFVQHHIITLLAHTQSYMVCTMSPYQMLNFVHWMWSVTRVFEQDWSSMNKRRLTYEL